MQEKLNLKDVDHILSIMSNVLEVRASGDPGKAPTIDNWATVSLGSNYRLWGQVTGHPLGLDKDVMTSALFYLDPESGLARTRSRWYRLGMPLRHEGMEAYGTLVFGPYSHEAPVNEAIAFTQIMPDFLLLDAKRLGDEGQIQRATEIRDQWPKEI